MHLRLFPSFGNCIVILTLAACGAVLPSAIEAHESIPISGAIPDDEWERLDQFDGITIFQRKVPGSSLMAFKGEGVIRAPLDRVMSVIMDAPRRIEWMTRVRSAVVVKEPSKFERVEYVHMGTPWPLQDRDFIYHATLGTDGTGKVITFKAHSVEDATIPEVHGRVRAEVTFSDFLLKSTPEGETWVAAQVHVDPKGIIPAFIVNMVQRKFPRTSLAGLMRQVVKPDVTIHPLIADLLKPAAALQKAAIE
ncbi:MAG: START domain-containing protein [Bdellovibrionota bacterium]